MLVLVAVVDEAGGGTRFRLPGGCDEWGCGTNHNETLVRDAAPAG